MEVVGVILRSSQQGFRVWLKGGISTPRRRRGNSQALIPTSYKTVTLKMRETISFGGQSTSDSSCLRSPDTTCMNSGKTTRVSTHKKLSLTTKLSGLNLPLQVMKLLHKTSLAYIDITQDHFQLSIRYVHVLRLGESPIPIQIRYLVTTANPTFPDT